MGPEPPEDEATPAGPSPSPAILNGMSSSSRESNRESGRESAAKDRKAPLYFFPDEEVSEQELREVLSEGSAEKRAWAISHLLRYAQWEDIWTYVTREEVREVFPELDLPENLRTAWARMLKIETPVG